MKKYLFLLVLLFVPLVSSASITSNLQSGSRGSQVTELQDFLIDNGYLSGTAATGYFGALTTKAVKAFQADQGLPTSGLVRNLTRVAIRAKIVAEITPTKQPVVATPTPTPTADTTSFLQQQVAQLQTQVQAQQQTIQQIQQNVPSPTPTRRPEPTPISTVSMRIFRTYGPIAQRTNTILWDSTMSVANEQVTLKSLRLRYVGSAPFAVLQNLNLYIDNVAFGTASKAPENGSNYITFNDTLMVGVGDHSFELRGDVIGGDSSSFSLGIQNWIDVKIIDKTGLEIHSTFPFGQMTTENQTIPTN